jgi:hypothetical protein
MQAVMVTRLPTQHRTHPHCANCKRDLPSFSSMEVSMSSSELGETRVLSMTTVFRVRCVCGAEWDMKKEGRV